MRGTGGGIGQEGALCTMGTGLTDFTTSRSWG